jgi:hypothetical protein
MERSLLIGASALGVVAWLLSVALSRSERETSLWRLLAAPFRWAIVVLPTAVFLLSLPSSPPFSAGQGFGRGFLIGAVSSLLAAIAIAGARRSERAALNAANVAAPLWIAIPATAIPLLFMRPVLIDALMGVAIGFLSIAAIVHVGLANRDEGTDESRGLALLSGAGFAVVLTVAAALGAYRGTEVTESSRWAAVAVIAGTAVPLGVWLASLPPLLLLGPLRRLPGASTVASKTAEVLRTERRREMAATGLRFVIGTVVVLVADRLLATRLLAEVNAFYAGAIGLCVGFLAWWLSSDGAISQSGSYRLPLAVLVALGAAMAAFNLLLGFGIAIMSLALWLPLSLALCASYDVSLNDSAERRQAALEVATTLWSVAALTVVLVLFRFVSTRFQTDLRGVTLTDHYAIFGLLAGATIPAITAGIGSGNSELRPFARLLRLIAAGLLTLALPGLILVLWKAKAALALLAGAALASAGFDWLGGRKEAFSAGRLFVPLMAIAVCLALAQWSPHVLEVASLTRDQKISVLKWLLGGIASIIVAVDLADRWQKGRNRDNSGRGAENMEGAR